MQSFSRGWSFLQEAWRIAFKDKDLLKPSIYSLIVGAIVSIIGLIPLVVIWIFSQGTTIGEVLLFVFGAVLVFAHFVVSYVFSGMTVYLIYQYLTEGDGKMSTAWSIVRRDFFDLVTLAAVSTIVNILKNAAQRNRRRRGRLAAIGASMFSATAGFLEVLWTEASYLILPAMVIEDINLMDGGKRVAQIVRDNLLLVGISTVGVRAVTGLIGFLLGAVGAVLGFGVGYGIILVLNSSTFGLILGIGLGMMIFFAFTIVASVINSYTTTAYHTCLYLWARNVEQAQTSGQYVQIPAPGPLAAVLG